MPKHVISFVADDGYLDHARSFLVNCKRQGQWGGDYCMISPENCNNQDIEQRGIFILRVPTDEWNFLVKFHAFTPYFHQWDKALCLDLDMLVQDNLQRVFDELSPKDSECIYGVQEDGDTLGALKRWDTEHEQHEETYKELEAQYPFIRESQMFNAAFLFYTPGNIPTTTKDELFAVHEKYKEVNPSNADQMIINLHLFDRLRLASKNCTCFFGGDYPENRVVSETRGWDGTEVPVILHYTRWHAPWIVKCICDDGNEMGGYRNHRLGRLCHELYAENLAAFDTEFPLR